MSPPQFLFTSLLFLTILNFSCAADTLFANQTLVDGELLTSPSQIFELGFFSPNLSSTSRFLGIWFKATPDVVVWVANRQSPVRGRNGVLTLYENGDLILSSAQGTTIWSSNSSTASSSPILSLHDDGNLVVVENSLLWQSFDYPGNTLLPGMRMVNDPNTGSEKHLTSWKRLDDPSEGEMAFKIENEGLSQLTVVMGLVKKYRSGPWEGTHFTGIPLVSYKDDMNKAEFSSDGKLISITKVYNASSSSSSSSLSLPVMRVTLLPSGDVQHYRMNETGNGWMTAFSEPRDLCTNYGYCGPNGICRAYKQPVCECLSGFVPKSQKEWDFTAYKGGCTRVLPLNCKKEDGFKKFERIKFPDTLNFRLIPGMSRRSCRDQCLENCNCTAYADPYLSTQTSGCLMWFGDLIDVQELTKGLKYGPNIYIRVPISELENHRKGPSKLVAAAVIASFGMFLCLGVVIRRVRRKRKGCKKKMEELKLPLFGLASIAAATNNFSRQNMIGEGGFGPVYKGNLSTEQVIAVKRMSRKSGQGAKEFKNEVTLIAKLQHRNLVRILGCCIERDEKILVYEYMHNKSLDYFIFDENRSALLDWPKRFDIIMGIARGLLYLHHDSRLKIIHRDLKTSNILLDEALNAKISDFGLARMFEGDEGAIASTRRVVGTYGYMSPEYAFEGKLSVKLDVFSMGVVILEIVSGKKNRGFKHPCCYQNLLEQAWLLWKEYKELEVMDPCYESSFVEWQVRRCIQVGLLCVQKDADERPMMASVVMMLSSEDIVLPEPKKPGYFLNSSNSSDPSQMYASGNCVTMSEVEGR